MSTDSMAERLPSRRKFDQALIRALRRVNILFKLSYMTILVYIVMAAFTSPRSAPAQMVEHYAFGGSVTLMLLAMILMLMAYDIVINNWLPDRFVFQLARDHLHWIYLIGGGLCLIPAFVSSHIGLTPPSATFLYVSRFLVGAGYSVISATVTGHRRVMEKEQAEFISKGMPDGEP